MTLEEAQADIRRAYVGGGPGAIVSGVVWLFAAVMVSQLGVPTGFVALFLGGMLIYPAGVFLSRKVFRRTAEDQSNQLGRTALESTIAMIGLFFAAWLFLPVQRSLVFPLSAMAVGLHYLAFRTVYGDATYWLLAAVITGIGFMGIYGILPSAGLVAIAVGVVEVAFGLLLTKKAGRVAAYPPPSTQM